MMAADSRKRALHSFAGRNLFVLFIYFFISLARLDILDKFSKQLYLCSSAQFNVSLYLRRFLVRAFDIILSVFVTYSHRDQRLGIL